VIYVYIKMWEALMQSLLYVEKFLDKDKTSKRGMHCGIGLVSKPTTIPIFPVDAYFPSSA
jgi:hypothetical protein